MDEKDLDGLFRGLAPSYSYMDYPRFSMGENQEGDLIVTRRVTDLADLNWAAEQTVIEQTVIEKLLAKKELSVAETLDLYKRGLKPYFYSYRPNTLVELTLENENEIKDKISITNTKWLHPKIAEKIQARYQEMNDLVQKKGAAIREIDSQIEDLKLRISMIEETGTDLII
jgi:hypothetical protein